MSYWAKKPIKMSDGSTRQPGEPIPEAEAWVNKEAYKDTNHIEWREDPYPDTDTDTDTDTSVDVEAEEPDAVADVDTDTDTEVDEADATDGPDDDSLLGLLAFSVNSSDPEKMTLTSELATGALDQDLDRLAELEREGKNRGSALDAIEDRRATAGV